MRILALDIGSTSIKAGYWNGRAFAAQVRVKFPTHYDGTRAEVPTDTLLKAILEAGAGALKGVSAVDAISFCTFSSGVVVADGTGRAITPIITHADRRSSATSLKLVERRPKSWWLARTGNLPYPGGIGSSTLAWLRKNQPALFRKSYRVGQVSSFVTSFLTSHGGNAAWVIDPSQACFLGLYDIRRHEWNKEVCAVVGVSREALPEIRWADERLGGLAPAHARQWGIAAGTPVVGGFVDTSAAVIQTPMHAGQLAHNAGSTDVLALCVERPHPAEGILTRPVGVSGKWHAGGARRGRDAVPTWLAVRTIASAGSAIEWARATLFPELKPAAWLKLATEVCKGIEKSTCAGVRDEPAALRCMPTFVGERASLVQPAGASFTGIRLGTDRRELLAALLRGLTVQSAENYARLAAINVPRVPRRTVYVMGGASALADAMHAAWPRRHEFRHLPADGLRGLVLLAERATWKC